MWNVVDRRTERSSKLDSALKLLLRNQRQRGELDLIALVTTDGMLVAWDGPKEVCEELAAYAPFMARGRAFAVDARRVRGVTVHAFLVERQELILVMRGHHTDVNAALALASMRGAARILRG